MTSKLPLGRVPGGRLLAALFASRIFRVEGPSMEPSYQKGHLYLVDRTAYRFRRPRRGEVAALGFPSQGDRVFFKRLVGLPGETVNLAQGRVFINGGLLAEPYAHGEDKSLDFEWALADDQYLAFGDNRTDSLDSRRLGPMRRRDLVGRVWLRCWPPVVITKIGHY